MRGKNILLEKEYQGWSECLYPWFFVFYGKDFEIALKKWIKRVIIEEGMKLKKVNVV